MDAADDPEAGSLKKVQANATKTFFPHVACRRERLCFDCAKSRGSQRSYPPNTRLYSAGAGIAHLDCAFGCAPLMPALGMQAEHLDNEVGPKTVLLQWMPPHLDQAQKNVSLTSIRQPYHFLEEPLPVMRATVESSAAI